MSMLGQNLQDHAHKLALEHEPHGGRFSPKALWRQMEADVEGLRDFIKQLHEDRSSCEQPSEEWLLDHSEFLESELSGIQIELEGLRAKQLPIVMKANGKDTKVRIASICEAYLEHTDGQLEEDSFALYFNSYQEISVLTSAECWSAPLFMKMEMIRRLAGLMEPVKERRQICKKVDQMLSGIAASDLTPERLKLALDEANVDLPLSGAMIVHLVKHLREHAEDTAHIGEWLVCKLDNAPDDLDAILSYEYRLQAVYQVSTGNVISSLRTLSRWIWSDLFEQISVIEQTLRGEQAGDYVRLDGSSRHTLRYRVEQLAGRMKVTENLVASQATQLANAVFEAAKGKPEQAAVFPPRAGNTAYYLLEARGMRKLQQALKQCGKTGALPQAGIKRRAAGLYIQLSALFTVAALIAFFFTVGASGPITPLGWAAALLLLVIPASEWGVTAIHWLIERVAKPIRLLRYDFSKGIPEDAATMVVIPVIWSRKEDVTATAQRLELHYLANRDPKLRFAILSDFRDADQERLLEDEAILRAAEAEIEKLNRSYPGQVFHLFHRSRKWNASEQAWMGWERKRGKLEEFVKLLRGDKDTSFSFVYGDKHAALGSIRYVITLDADTQLPLESAKRMIGAIHLPFNRPRLNENKTSVVEGYGVLQPRIGMTYESARRSRLTSLYAYEAGLDPYAFAVSDPYQDAIGQGIFTGKGIFDVDAFYHVLGNRLPENRVLSHDLLEGGFLRAGLLSDIELIDDHPPTFLSMQKRLHRWIRGDWQLLPWLAAKARNGSGELAPTYLSLMTRWQIFDNLRRSLLQPALFIVLMLAAPVLPGPFWGWLSIVLLTHFLPAIRQLFTPFTLVQRPASLLRTLGHGLISFMTMPFQSALLLGAIVRTVYRLAISKRRLLEWTSQAEVERTNKDKAAPAMAGLGIGYLLIVLMAAGVFTTGSVSVFITGIVICLLWSFAPLAIRWLDQPPVRDEAQFSKQEQEMLLKLARDIWAFYEDFVTEKDNWLPPDNVQIEPDRGIAHRTSPTNIGMYVTCALAARDFGFIDTPNLVERLEQTVGTIERMKKWEGHLYNWYDTESLAPLLPIYVSTVDSGNMVASLMTAKEGLLEWLRADSGQELDDPLPSKTWPQKQKEDRFEVAFSDELGAVDWTALNARGQRLASRIDKLIHATDFRPLLDGKTNLLSLGYHVTSNKRDDVLYDLLASEARQASFVAIALGQVSVAHWNALGRTLTKTSNRPLLLSWSGTMFEYLMPWLLMKTYRNTIWDSTYRAVVDRQIDYARQHNVPFGISESGYYAFDHQMNYQYRAFGVPGLGFKRGLEQDLVLAPYATVMALPYAPKEGLQALGQMEQLGARGKYGYYEALDFTPRRMQSGRKNEVIRSFMAHHQGMSMLTLSNLLSPFTMTDRFHRNKEVRSAELLLQERVPRRSKRIKHPALYRSPGSREQAKPEHNPIREFKSPHTATPEACLLSNGRFSTMVTASGSGHASWEGLSVTRWREEPVRDSWGSYIYIRDVFSDRIWSPSYQPCRTETLDQRVYFEPDKATFTRTFEGVETCMEICVSPETDTEVRRITLTNRGDAQKVLEVTSFLELALANPIADDAHPAFSKLFVRTAYEAGSELLVASRRKREEKDRALWATHTLTANSSAVGSVEFETDRVSFIGRGHRLSAPSSIRSRLKAKTGSVADPAFVMRRRVQIEPGEKVQLFAITSVAETREDAVESTSKLAHAQAVERAFQLAWTRSRVELRSLHLDQAEALSFQKLAGQILYTPPLSSERALQIEANTKSQPGLWSFGISGDKPIVLAQIENQSHMPFIMKLLTGHEYLRRLGLRFDLVFLNDSNDGYQQNLQDALSRAVEHGVDRFGTGAAGIHVLPTNRLTAEDIALLKAVARVTLRAGGPSLAGQLRLPKPDENAAWPEPLQTVSEPAQQQDTAVSKPAVSVSLNVGQDSAHAPAWSGKDVQFFNGWGGFSEDGKQYKLLIANGKHLPGPWINVLANSNFGALVSELGTGYSFWRNSRECKLTPWSNDPVLDPPGELCFLRDEASGEIWTTAPSAGEDTNPYEVTHGLGFTAFEHESEDIRHKMTMYVPIDDAVKIMRLKLTNRSSRTRHISVTYYAEWVIGVQRQSNAPYISSVWDEEAQILTAQNRYQETFRDATPFLGIFPQKAADREGLSWTADQQEFIGRNGSAERPEALSRERLSGRDGIFNASCGAIQRKLVLEAGEETEVILLLGCAPSRQEAAELARRYADAAACDAAWMKTAAYWEETLGQIVVETPSPDTDIMLNGWLLYQSLACRMWARSAFYQAGGAFGFRDQLQDSLALLHSKPELTRKQIALNASHQYEEGDVQHWWHEETERGIRTLFSDDLLWLPYSTSRYIEHTGDSSVLEDRVAYIKSHTLQEGEYERYEETIVSEQTGTIYEHCNRAIDKALSRIGEHGIPLFGVGDWNDGMNLVGEKGRGESVWLGWFLYEVLQRFGPICAERGEGERAERYKQAREKLAEANNAHAWDGQWYRRAFTDAGTWLGSLYNEECRIDSIAQSWSIISGAAPKDRAVQAMQSFDRELVDRDLSVARLLTPPFDRTEPSPGYIQGYPPGIRENGAQYTHGVIWSIIAWSKLGNGDKAFELFRMLNPVNHTRTDQEVRQYFGEPYVMAADVYTSEPHLGHAGWTWYTGASGWMYQSGIEWILGLRKRGDRLYLDPRVPSDWPGFKATYRFGDTKYQLEFTRESSGQLQAGPEAYIELKDDKQEHRITIRL
ncbi:glucoamylase family protein [Paenibacillus sp. NEAU-GSW1]|uniref:GH36-type glycosyl hydrolase domain-containing protein n=1 Tax=Paenibacillus sp. NEAU-GSW1 TaxID=2682486 RepID=UPI0012E29E06|nr:glucoamylase family protein [Paenibacillus sp. NEAU-GSW1]MUT64825.1 glycosyl transferase family 36 [Paenibacillus sp. NEAU-GSW1]